MRNSERRQPAVPCKQFPDAEWRRLLHQIGEQQLFPGGHAASETVHQLVERREPDAVASTSRLASGVECQRHEAAGDAITVG